MRLTTPSACARLIGSLLALAVLAFASLSLETASGSHQTDWIAFARGNASIREHKYGVDSPLYPGGEDPDWSPDGTRIAFAQGQDLFIMNADGTGVTSCVASGFEEQTPKWSPDGTRIAYGQKNGDFDVWVINVSGFTCSGPTALTTDPTDDMRPAWYASSTMLAFDTKRGGNYDVYRMNDDGTNQLPVPLASGPGDQFVPAVASDGRVAYCGGQGASADIWVDNTQLTVTPGEDCQPDWSSDDTLIAYNSFRSGNADVWILDSSTGTNQRQVTTDPGYDDDPDWHPAALTVGGDVDILAVADDGSSFPYLLATLGAGIIALATLGSYARRRLASDTTSTE